MLDVRMQELDFEQSTELKRVSEDVYENVHPAWTWYSSGVVPGGLSMAMSAAAAYRTIPEGYALDNLSAQFLSGPKADIPFRYKVQRLSEGRRFIIRTVTVEQKGLSMVFVTLGFVNASPWMGFSMKHSVPESVKQRVDQITIDDLERGRSRLGPFMQFQRLPLVHRESKEPHTSIEPVVAQIIGPIKASSGTIPHMLGLVNLSDYHVLGAPPTLHGIDVGLPAIGDTSGRPTRNNVKLYTTLNHTIHFHAHNGFRADDLTYIEVTSPWTRDARGLAQSRIFSKDGLLIATCVQEAYYVFKHDAGSKL